MYKQTCGQTTIFVNGREKVKILLTHRLAPMFMQQTRNVDRIAPMLLHYVFQMHISETLPLTSSFNSLLHKLFLDHDIIFYF